MFVFDLNTPYKHQQILADGHFSVETPDACCQWDSRYDPDAGRVDLNVHIHYDETNESFEEHFCEYTYSLPQVRSALEQCGFQLEQVQDGETFGPLRADDSYRSQAIYAATIWQAVMPFHRFTGEYSNGRKEHGTRFV